jgi:hypothetical protein
MRMVADAACWRRTMRFDVVFSDVVELAISRVMRLRMFAGLGTAPSKGPLTLA